MDENKAPKHVIDDLVDCTVMGEIIELSSTRTIVSETEWSAMGLLGAGWATVKTTLGAAWAWF